MGSVKDETRADTDRELQSDEDGHEAGLEFSGRTSERERGKGGGDRHFAVEKSKESMGYCVKAYRRHSLARSLLVHCNRETCSVIHRSLPPIEVRRRGIFYTLLPNPPDV